MASAAALPKYDVNGDPYNGDGGDDVTHRLDSADTEGYTPTYKEAFPPLPTSAAREGQKLSQFSWSAQTQAIRSSTITQIFRVPLEERRFREMNEQVGESRQTHICRLVMDKTGASIQLSLAKDQSLTIVLTGKGEAVQKARMLILNQLQMQYTAELRIPKEHHRFVLGKNLAKLKQLELTSATKITVPKSDDPSEIVKISGTKENVDKASHEIQLISDEQAKLAFERLTIPKMYHPWISGPWNKTQKEIVEKTKARVNIPPFQVMKDEITVAGEKESVAVAKAMIMKIFEDKRKKSKTVSVEVKKSQHKYVIGPRRHTLQEILERTDVSVEVPQEGTSETITLRGEPDKLGPALTVVYEKANSIVTAEVHAPRWLHRFIIGQKGKNINSITQDLPKVHVEFSSDADEIQLEGPPEEVEQAKTALERFTKELTDTMNFAVIDVDQKFHRHIIGKSGGNVNRIKQRTGTSITIPADNSSIRIEGSHNGVAEAKKELLEMAAKLENERSKDVKIEHRFHKQIIGSQGQHIREVRERFPGVQITFPDPKSQIDMVNLRGPKDMVDKCCVFLKKQNDEMVAENFVAEVRVFKEFHKNVIGRGGGTIRKIRDETKTKIDLPTENSNSDVIVVTGRKQNVEEAKKLIEAIQNELANVTSVEVSIPAKLHQAVIGPKGQLIHAISAECGNVVIRFPSGKTAEGDKDKVTIRGPKGDVEKAKKQLMELANDRALHNHTIEVRAKPEFHRFIIGRGGANIQKIREETGARIVFPAEKDEDKSLVTVIGNEEAIGKAKARLEKMIADLENSVEIEVTVPTEYQRHFIQRRGQVLQDIAADCGGVIISFPRGSSTSDRVVVKGAKDCVELAKQRIAEEVEKLESQVTLDCVISHKHHRTVMGPKGHNVQQITADFDVGVKFPERVEDKSAVSDDGVTPVSDIIKIHGRKEQAEEAREALLALVPVTKELSIPYDYHRFIIGAKGKDVRSMMDKYNVRIAIPQADKHSDTITVSGVPSHVEDACKALLRRVRELDTQKEEIELRSFQLTVKVNSEHHPKIIGRRGVTISKIRAEHDVNIQFPDRDSDDSDTITIKGYQDRAEAARDAILKIVEELEEQVTDEVEIDARVHSRLIGTKGKAIRKVMDQYNVDIRFPKDKESSMVTISGLEENVEEAKDHLLNMEEEYLQDVIERLDEEAMMKQYTHAPSRDPSDDSSPHGSSGGFVVRGAPWSRASNGTQQSAREKPFVPELSPKDFPTIGDGTGSKTPPVWPVRKS